MISRIDKLRVKASYVEAAAFFRSKGHRGKGKGIIHRNYRDRVPTIIRDRVPTIIRILTYDRTLLCDTASA